MEEIQRFLDDVRQFERKTRLYESKMGSFNTVASSLSEELLVAEADKLLAAGGEVSEANNQLLISGKQLAPLLTPELAKSLWEFLYFMDRPPDTTRAFEVWPNLFAALQVANKPVAKKAKKAKKTKKTNKGSDAEAIEKCLDNGITDVNVIADRTGATAGNIRQVKSRYRKRDAP